MREHNERSSNEELIVGRNAVSEALRAGRPIDRLLVAKGDRNGRLGPILAQCRERGILIKETDPRRLDELCGSNHQGVAAVAACKEYATVEDILALAAERGEPPFVVLCDELEDPHNLGAILRTAECAGVHGVVIPKRRSAGLTAVVDKASAGAAEHMLVARVPNIPAALKELKEHGLWVYGTAANANGALWKTDMKGPICLVIGSEGFGMGRLVADSCDFTVSIPLLGKVTSLNASAAAAVMIYEVLRQRRG